VDKIDSVVAPRVARPPREWELQTGGLMVAVAVAAVLCMLLAVTDLAIRSYVLNDGVGGMSSLVAWVVQNYEVLSALLMLLGFAYIAGFIWWRRHTTAMLDSVGVSDKESVWHWTVGGWYSALAASFMIRFAANQTVTDDHDLPSWLAWDAAGTGARLVGLSFLLIAVWQIRDQVHAKVAESGVILRIRDLAPRPSTVPLPAAVLPVPPGPQSAELLVADDDFWRRVSALATGLRTEIAVLETTDGLARRWLLVPSSGRLAEVRSAMAPGAVVTAFPQPPAATETKAFTPRPADQYHGLLEDNESGALWYQSIRPNRVGAFLAQARRARRWALYPTAGPDALSAVIPPTA
jgi:hypothetical protein